MENLINLTPLFEALIVLFFAFLTVKVLPLIQARLDDEEERKLGNLVHIAVYAAEKLYGAGMGKEKLLYAEEFLREQYGVEVEFDKLIGLINAEIQQMDMLTLPAEEIVVEPDVGAEDDLIDTEEQDGGPVTI